MNLFYAFIICGGISMIGQLIYDNTKLTPGHITSMFVILGTFLDIFHVYDKLVELSVVGASLPIVSFGHSLAHAAWIRSTESGFLGIASGMFDKTASGIIFSIFMATVIAFIFKPRS